ncbi:MAG: hypothetical protein LBE20_03675 [Deltaproteobacteria bacterium]|jgi:hypothetical protein|nr:hypothetical protein [Deltaproteobacteria bacterium]
MSSISFDRWVKLTIFEQMGNIGSEVGRAIAAERRGDTLSRNGAIFRALDLFAATSKSLAIQKSPRLREVLRARDQFLSLFFDSNFSEADKIENYFMQFALAARRKDR